MTATHDDLVRADLAAVRDAIRTGAYERHTAGLAKGFLQANLAILPSVYALDFLRFCQRNPKPCPVVGVSDTGDPMLATLGDAIDVRTDVPRYRVFRNGAHVDDVGDIKALWRDDFVAVALGCSFTFEHALQAAGIHMRHIDRDTTVAMYRTNRPLVPAGPFTGTMVVSMRPIKVEEVDRTVEICRAFPLAHGAPIHVGDPSAIGIDRIDRPDYGDPTPIDAGEVPVFWACGVTPQNVILNARPEICITHVPGHMLITDIAETADIPVYQHTQGSPS
ncbi:MAG: putative hydro-lyase [Pseudomonadota bacterium]